MLFVLALNFSVSAQPKDDPWIFNAYKEMYNRQPSFWELNILLYNGGSWNSYPQLKSFITEYQNSMSSQGITIKIYTSGDKSLVAFDKGNKTIAVDLISNDGGRVLAAGGGNVIAAVGGNVIAAGGGNIVAGEAVNFSSLGGVLPSRTNSGMFSGGSIRVKSSGKGSLVFTQ